MLAKLFTISLITLSFSSYTLLESQGWTNQNDNLLNGNYSNWNWNNEQWASAPYFTNQGIYYGGNADMNVNYGYQGDSFGTFGQNVIRNVYPNMMRRRVV